MEQQSSGKHSRCQAKLRGKGEDSDEYIHVSDTNSEEGENVAASSPEPANGEKNTQIYPWMKEFRSKGTK